MTRTDLHRLIDELPDEVIERIAARRPVTLVLTEDGDRPKLKSVHPDQWWFWTPEWQEGEREIDEARARGERGEIFYSAEEFLAALEAGLKPLD
jgi:hypothetical protein